jgi:hypothetical protein
MAAEQPRKTKNRVYIHPSVATRQSHPDANSSAKKLMSLAQAAPVPAVERALDSGSQNTEKP